MIATHIILTLLYIVDALDSTHKHLNVDVTLYNQILYDGESMLFQIDNIKKYEKYEVRISYPAVIPTQFEINILNADVRTFNTRKLLSVEQHQFMAESDSYNIKVTAHRNGVPVDVERLKDPIIFNIIVNRLYLGCSIETWKILAFACVLVILIYTFSYQHS